MLAIWVTVHVKRERREEFLDIIAEDSRGSREDEPGCYRFDVLQDREHEDVFHFYEVYADDDAAAIHRTMPHFQPWAEFVETGLEAPPELTRTEVVLPEPTTWPHPQQRSAGEAAPS